MYQCGGPPAPSPPPPSPTPARCVDQPYSPQDCAGWKGAGYCSPQSSEYGFMRDHCPKTCGFCRGCSDREVLVNCQVWKDAGHCFPRSSQYNSAKYWCANMCDACDSYSASEDGTVPRPLPVSDI